MFKAVSSLTRLLLFPFRRRARISLEFEEPRRGKESCDMEKSKPHKEEGEKEKQKETPQGRDDELHGLDEDELAAEIQEPETGFGVADRSYHLKKYKECFVASEAVDWLVKRKKLSREQATTVCENLRKAGIFEHVTDQHKQFKDDFLFFRFTSKPKIVIIGGGFAGSKLAKKLQGHFSVTVIDKKPYFISLPSLPACVCDPTHISSIRAEHKNFLKHCKVIHDTVVDVDATSVYLKHSDKKVPFDYLIVCTGSRYNITLKGNDKVKIVNPIDPDEVVKTYNDLLSAQHVVVIGGGPVGVEVAGEIAHYFPDKNLTIVHGPEKFLERTAPKANKNIKRFFNGCKNVRCVLGEKVVSVDDDGYLTTNKGTRIQADLVYVCVGFVPNTEFLRKNFSDRLTDNGLVKVDPLFCTEGSEGIFAIGDIIAIPEEKLAQTAEKHADLLAQNLIGLKRNKTPQPYKPASRVMIVSLGPKKAIIIKGPDVYLEGLLASKMKQLVEFKIMRGL